MNNNKITSLPESFGNLKKLKELYVKIIFYIII